MLACLGDLQRADLLQLCILRLSFISFHRLFNTTCCFFNSFFYIIIGILILLQIALRRERLGETAPFWRFSAASYPDLEEAPSNAAFLKKVELPRTESATSSVCIVHLTKSSFPINLFNIFQIYLPQFVLFGQLFLYSVYQTCFEIPFTLCTSLTDMSLYPVHT